MKLNNRGNGSLIGLLAVVAIIAIAAALYFGKGSGMTVKNNSKLLDKASTKQTVVGKSIDTGKSVDCREHLNQIRTAITNYKITGEQNPASLNDLKMGVGADYFKCPVTGQAYTYDPATGRVSCPSHPNF